MVLLKLLSRNALYNTANVNIFSPICLTHTIRNDEIFSYKLVGWVSYFDEFFSHGKLKLGELFPVSLSQCSAEYGKDLFEYRIE